MPSLQSWEENYREKKNMFEKQEYPFFSSTLLDKIYNSINEGCEAIPDEPTFYRRAISRREDTTNSHWQGRSIEKLMEKRADDKLNSQKMGSQRRQLYKELERKTKVYSYVDQYPLSSASSTSSDSSSGGFSSSDSEHGDVVKTRVPSCFAPLRLKPVKTSAAQKPKNKNKGTLFQEPRTDRRVFDGFPQRVEDGGSGPLKSKASKIYENLRKVKQPISPGGRLATFINSLFTSSGNNGGNNNIAKKDMKSSLGERKVQTDQSSAWSSASSFSRSCLSKNTPSMKEKVRNGVARTVRFYPVTVVYDETSRPHVHKWLCEEERKGEENARPVSVSEPKAWRIGRPQPRSSNAEITQRVVLTDNYQGNKKGFQVKDSRCDDGDEDGDDAASCTSSDLFELDHLSVAGMERYSSELPVYETTRISSNRDLKL